MTYRELYFQTLKRESTYLTNNVIRSLLIKAGGLKDMEELSLSFDKECKNIDEFNRLILEVEKGRPYQYVINSSNFCHLDFYVDERVLIPRNETEELTIELIKRIKELGLDNFNLLDLCTGSGCIAIALANEFKKAVVVGTDISFDALEVAKLNNQRLNANVTFYQGNIADPIVEKELKFDVLVSNPPYIKSEESVDELVLKNEPHIALFAFPQLRFYQSIILAIPVIMNDGGLVAFEIEDDMEDRLTDIIKKVLPRSTYEFKKDFYGKTRFLFIKYMKDERLNLDKAASILKNGGIVCFPTETVMGLGVVFDDYEAYKRLNIIKNRPNDKPYTLMLDSYEKVSNFACISITFTEIVEKCNEFPMTFLLKKKDTVKDFVTHGTDVIGIRVPDHAQIKYLIQKVGKPLLVPSANKSGNKPALNSKEARDIFGNEVDYYIEGECLGGVPSTIIDLTGEDIKIVREGTLSLDEIKRRLDK